MKTKSVQAFTKAVDETERTIEQVVSVFDNVDLGGDIVKPGAFTNSLARWNASENVLPAYFSHQWGDPFANIGSVISAEEAPAGDERLPADEVVTPDGKTVRDLGGLLVKYQFDPEGENPTADQVFRLLKRRRINQASFAYDIVKNKRNSDGTQDLEELELIEVGPTLLGMNPATTLLASKSISELAAETGLTEDQVKSVVEAAETKSVAHAFIASEDNSSVCAFPGCGKGPRSVAHIMRLSADGPDGAKAISFTGSVEERQRSVYELGRAWAQGEDVGAGGFYMLHQEATFDDKVIFLVEGWDDPLGEGTYFEAALTNNEDGTVSMDTPVEVVIEPTIRPKSRRKSLDSATRRKSEAIVPDQDEEEVTDPDNAEAGDGNAEVEEPEAESESEDEDEVPADATKARERIELLHLKSV